MSSTVKRIKNSNTGTSSHKVNRRVDGQALRKPNLIIGIVIVVQNNISKTSISYSDTNKLKQTNRNRKLWMRSQRRLDTTKANYLNTSTTDIKSLLTMNILKNKTKVQRMMTMIRKRKRKKFLKHLQRFLSSLIQSCQQASWLKIWKSKSWS